LKDDLDQKIRLAAFEWLSKQLKIYGDVLPRELLAKGFQFQSERVPFVAPQGIFKPRLMELPLSITTTPSGPYDDSFDEHGLLSYRYRGTDLNHQDNQGLKKAMASGTPLVYFHGVVPGKYLAIWPVYIVGDFPDQLMFKVAADDMAFIQRHHAVNDSDIEPRRAYITATVRQRLHQRGFRERVLEAYREQCAFCRLRHLELLDAAHIIPDSDPQGTPNIRNGIALCKLHHAAFDANIVGIRPDYVIEIRHDVLREKDGPMLLHGLQELNKTKIILPSKASLSPDPILLEKRYSEFKAA